MAKRNALLERVFIFSLREEDNALPNCLLCLCCQPCSSTVSSLTGVQVKQVSTLRFWPSTCHRLWEPMSQPVLCVSVCLPAWRAEHRDPSDVMAGGTELCVNLSPVAPLATSTQNYSRDEMKKREREWKKEEWERDREGLLRKS